MANRACLCLLYSGDLPGGIASLQAQATFPLVAYQGPPDGLALLLAVRLYCRLLSPSRSAFRQLIRRSTLR